MLPGEDALPTELLCAGEVCDWPFPSPSAFRSREPVLFFGGWMGSGPFTFRRRVKKEASQGLKYSISSPSVSDVSSSASGPTVAMETGYSSTGSRRFISVTTSRMGVSCRMLKVIRSGMFGVLGGAPEILTFTVIMREGSLAARPCA